MTNPEDVDEINEYLVARKKKQELGELPKPVSGTGFFRKIQHAVFGASLPAKVPLNSTQSTRASPQAQIAVRKQLEEIMQERNRTSVPPSVSTPSPSPSSRFPQDPVWKNISKPDMGITVPRMEKPTPSSSRSSPTPSSPTPPLRETARYMPPWVARQQNGTTSASPARVIRERKESTSITPINPAKYIPPSLRKESTSASSLSETSSLPPFSQRPESPPKQSSFSSGEIRVENIIPISKPIPLPKNDSVSVPSSSDALVSESEHEREITEEEALEKLPFEGVQGLSEEDLAYLERKEHEHRAAQEQRERDHAHSEELRAQLARQTREIPNLPDQGDKNTGNDEKKKILERLRQMMAKEKAETQPPFKNVTN